MIPHQTEKKIAVLSALEVLDIGATIISSCGSSSFGATDTTMIWLDMEKYLFDKKIINNQSTLASIGGASDIGRNMLDSGKELCKRKISNILKKEILFPSIVFKSGRDINLATSFSDK